MEIIHQCSQLFSDMEDEKRGSKSLAGVVKFYKKLSGVARDFELLFDWLYDSISIQDSKKMG